MKSVAIMSCEECPYGVKIPRGNCWCMSPMMINDCGAPKEIAYPLYLNSYPAWCPLPNLK